METEEPKTYSLCPATGEPHQWVGTLWHESCCIDCGQVRDDEASENPSGIE